MTASERKLHLARNSASARRRTRRSAEYEIPAEFPRLNGSSPLPAILGESSGSPCASSRECHRGEARTKFRCNSSAAILRDSFGGSNCPAGRQISNPARGITGIVAPLWGGLVSIAGGEHGTKLNRSG